MVDIHVYVPYSSEAEFERVTPSYRLFKCKIEDLQVPKMKFEHMKSIDSIGLQDCVQDMFNYSPIYQVSGMAACWAGGAISIISQCYAGLRAGPVKKIKANSNSQKAYPISNTDYRRYRGIFHMNIYDANTTMESVRDGN